MPLPKGPSVPAKRLRPGLAAIAASKETGMAVAGCEPTLGEPRVGGGGVEPGDIGRRVRRHCPTGEARPRSRLLRDARGARAWRARYGDQDQKREPGYGHRTPH